MSGYHVYIWFHLVRFGIILSSLITVQHLVYRSSEQLAKLLLFGKPVGTRKFEGDKKVIRRWRYLLTHTQRHRANELVSYISHILCDWNVSRNVQHFSTTDEMTCQPTWYWVSKNLQVDVLVSLRRRHHMEWRRYKLGGGGVGGCRLKHLHFCLYYIFSIPHKLS